jgi:hypothetical protein
MRNIYKILAVKAEEKRPLGKPSVSGRVILNRISKK